jgi:hypothetical protein
MSNGAERPTVGARPAKLVSAKPGGQRFGSRELVIPLDVGLRFGLPLSAILSPGPGRSLEEPSFVLQTFRSFGKYIFWGLLITFVGGFLFYESSGLFGRDTGPTLGSTAIKVNGEEVTYGAWQRAVTTSSLISCSSRSTRSAASPSPPRRSPSTPSSRRHRS